MNHLQSVSAVKYAGSGQSKEKRFRPDRVFLITPFLLLSKPLRTYENAPLIFNIF